MEPVPTHVQITHGYNTCPPEEPKSQSHEPIYPPEDRGISLVGAAALINIQSDLIQRIRLSSGFSESEFDMLYMQPVKNLASYIDALPATEHGHHNGAGGLFRLCLELGFFSMQAAEGVIFSAREGVERRRLLEPRWRYATFLAGLCCELHRLIREMIVVTPDGKEWPVLRMGMGQWLGSDGHDHYFVRWVKGNSHGYGSTSILVPKVVPDDCLQYIQAGGNHIIPVMLDVISGSPRPNEQGVMHDVVNSIRIKVIEKDNALSVTHYGRLTVGAHLEPHLLDAMRRLTKDKTWAINHGKARLWFNNEGLFLIWKTAAREMIDVLKQSGAQGIPQDSATLLDILCKTGVFSENKDGSPFWMIIPPDSKNELPAVKFTNPETLLGVLDDYPQRVGSLFNTPSVPEEDAETDGDVVQEIEEDAHAQNEVVAPESSDAALTELQQHIVEVAQKESTNFVPREIDLMLSILTKDVLNAILADFHKGLLQGSTGQTNDGYAIEVEMLSGYGVDVHKIISEFHKLGWLFTPSEKPGKKIHHIKINERNTQSILLKEKVARDLGFIKP